MLLITTPTGNIGSRVLRNLAQQGTCSLRVIVRNPEKLSQQIKQSVEVVEGSHNDSVTLARALEGVDAMFWCQPDSITEENYYGFYRDFASAGCEAIRRQATPRVVVLSSAGGGFPGEAGPITALREMENILARSGANLRFLRCGSFFENFLFQIESLRNEGAFFYPMAGNVPHPMVASEDIAETAARWLTRSDWTNIDGIPVLGPVDLTYDQVANILSRACHRPIQFIKPGIDAYRESLLQVGYRRNAADALIAMFAAIEQGTATTERRDPRETGATTLESWAATNLRPLLDHVPTPPA